MEALEGGVSGPPENVLMVATSNRRHLMPRGHGEDRGLIASFWGTSENNRKAKYYSLTVKGKRQLHLEAEKWNRMTDVIGGILNTAPEEL